MMQSKGEEEACEDDFPQKSIMWNPRAEEEAEGKNRVKGEAELEVCLLVEREVREELGWRRREQVFIDGKFVRRRGKLQVKKEMEIIVYVELIGGEERDVENDIFIVFLGLQNLIHTIVQLMFLLNYLFKYFN